MINYMGIWDFGNIENPIYPTYKYIKKGDCFRFKEHYILALVDNPTNQDWFICKKLDEMPLTNILSEPFLCANIYEDEAVKITCTKYKDNLELEIHNKICKLYYNFELFNITKDFLVINFISKTIIKINNWILKCKSIFPEIEFQENNSQNNWTFNCNEILQIDKYTKRILQENKQIHDWLNNFDKIVWSKENE